MHPFNSPTTVTMAFSFLTELPHFLQLGFNGQHHNNVLFCARDWYGQHLLGNSLILTDHPASPVLLKQVVKIMQCHLVDLFPIFCLSEQSVTISVSVIIYLQLFLHLHDWFRNPLIPMYYKFNCIQQNFKIYNIARQYKFKFYEFKNSSLRIKNVLVSI